MNVDALLISISALLFGVNLLLVLKHILGSTPLSPERSPLSLAVLPITLLMALLCINVVCFGDATLEGPNQLALLGSAGLATLLARKVGYHADTLWGGVRQAIGDTLEAIFILLLIGALAGTWMLSGVVPAMINYGLMIMSPAYFLFASCALCALVSLASGSSWSTIATVGVALLGIGQALGFSPGLSAGAIISGAYFGDKMSPLSDTTNLAPAMAGGSLIPHIRAMFWTTGPTMAITLVIFALLGLGASGEVDSARVEALQQGLQAHVWIHPILFVVPALVGFLIYKRIPTLLTLVLGTLLGGVIAVVAQPALIEHVGGSAGMAGSFKAVVLSMSGKITLPADDPIIQKLLSSKGMFGMLTTVWLTLCALAFGGVMESSGFLNQITNTLLRRVQSNKGLVTATASTSVFLNVTASDQYLAIVVPGRMYRPRFEENGLAPEALSRTLEDAGTVTSVLVPWNTCGATQSAVLGVATLTYLPFCFFNLLSPLMTVLFAWMGWRQPLLKDPNRSNEDLSAGPQL